MKERPILFGAPMVRAILEGRKTQTRRVVKGALPDIPSDAPGRKWGLVGQDFYYCGIRCPFGVLGDRLWVRETWGGDNMCGVAYRADHPEWTKFRGDGEQSDGPWRPSIHMPRWASRIALELTGVRVERVRDISEEDAKAEGVEAWEQTSWTGYDPRHDGYPTVFGETAPDWMEHAKIRIFKRSACEQFQSLWDSINKKRGFGWDKNPWVWALTFKRVSP